MEKNIDEIIIKGIPGKTPQKGVDYFDGKDGLDGKDGIDGKQGDKGEKGDKGDTGSPGKNGLNGKDGKKGLNGKDGTNGKDGSPDTPKQIKEKLLKVGLDYSEIDNVPDINKVINIAVSSVKQSSKTYSIPEMEDVELTDLTNSDALKWNSSKNKWENGSVSSSTTWGTITGTQSDVNVGGFTNDVGYLTSADLTGYVPNTRTLTINGTAFDLSADRSWSVGTVTSVAALTLGTTGTDLSSSVANGTTTPVITLNVPTASALNRGALSSADWGTFNSKESALTFSIGLTRVTDTITANLSTGVSGGQTAIGGTASGNNLTLSSTSNATKGKILFGTSAYDEVNNRLGIGTTAPGFPLMVSGTANVTGTLYVNNNGSGNGVGSVGTIQLGDSTISKSYGGGFMFNGGAALINGWNISGTGSLTNGGVVTSGYLLGSELRVGSGGSNGKITTDGNKILTFYNNTAGAERMRIDLSGNVGIGQSTPTATLHLRAGTASASTAPLKLASGTSLTTAESGAVEFTTDNLYFTITTGAARKNVTLDEGLTSGRVPFATTNGRLTDDADMTFATDTLTVTKLVGTTNIKVGTVAGYISSDGSTGATGIFTTVDLKTVTVKDGIITSIV